MKTYYEKKWLYIKDLEKSKKDYKIVLIKRLQV